jgi:hypothetical protein
MKLKIDKTWVVEVSDLKDFIRITVDRKEPSSEGRVTTLIINKVYKDGDAVNNWEFEGRLTSTDYDRGRVIVTAKDSEDEDVELLDQEFETQTGSGNDD